MKQHLLLILTLIACLLPSTKAEPPENDSTKNAANTIAHIGTDKGFGAQLYIIEDQNFFKNWNKPAKTIPIPAVNTVKRNAPVFIVVLFAGAGADEKNLCDVSYSVLITAPDGRKYEEIIDADCWKKLPPPAAKQIQLCRAYIGIKISDKDPSGRYTARAIVSDHIKSAKVELTQYFDVD